VSVNSELELRLASNDEQRAAHANCHDVWSMGMPLDAHVERRMTSAMHQRARWYVGLCEGHVVTGLGCHPTLFSVRGAATPGIAIASVHTLSSHRGRGFAPRLIEFVEREERAAGARLSVLFSDVGVPYYAQMGYRACPAHRAGAETPPQVAVVLRNLKLQPATVAEYLPVMQELHATLCRESPLYFVRTREYARQLTQRYPSDQCLLLMDGGEAVGYLQVALRPNLLLIRDLGVRDDATHLRRAMYELIFDRAQQLGLARVEGWLPRDYDTTEYFYVAARPQEITMFKPLDKSVVLDEACLAAADRVCEIDHV